MTRRNVLLAGGALAWVGVSQTAEAAIGSIELKIVSAGFIVGAGGGGGVLVFEGRRYPLSVGGISVTGTSTARRRSQKRCGRRPVAD